MSNGSVFNRDHHDDDDDGTLMADLFSFLIEYNMVELSSLYFERYIVFFFSYKGFSVCPTSTCFGGASADTSGDMKTEHTMNTVKL